MIFLYLSSFEVMSLVDFSPQNSSSNSAVLLRAASTAGFDQPINTKTVNRARVCVYVRATVPPMIEQQLTEFTVVEQREMVLPCRVSGLPTPTVRWLKDNVTISEDDLHYRILRSQWLAIPIVR